MDLDHYKQLLEERLNAINQGHYARQRESAPVQLDQSSVGRLSRMDAMQQQAMAQANARRLELEKQRIHTALKRLADGEYGLCVRCEEEIGERRLAIDPATLVCIDCARNAEQRLGEQNKHIAEQQRGEVTEKATNGSPELTIRLNGCYKDLSPCVSSLP